MSSEAKIPMPGLLFDHRGAASDRDPATSHEGAPIEDRPDRDPYNAAIDEPVTVYGRQLWLELDEVAGYLRGATGRLTTEDEWQQWQAVYARVLSVLAGPHGDEGYGAQEAQVLFQNGYRPGAELSAP